jgi:hypothetical protein
MSRIALVAVLAAAAATAVAVSCSKSAGNQEAAQQPSTRVEVPGADRGVPEIKGGPEGAPAKGGNDDAFRLTPEEGTLAIQVPGDAKAGQETIATVVVTPGPKYKINFEYPTKLTLQSPTGVTLAKAEFKAGGHDKEKGDAEAFEEKQLKFAVKLVPSSGNHTISGSFKFAVCDKDQCLAKKETIAIQVAAK